MRQPAITCLYMTDHRIGNLALVKGIMHGLKSGCAARFQGGFSIGVDQDTDCIGKVRQAENLSRLYGRIIGQPDTGIIIADAAVVTLELGGAGDEIVMGGEAVRGESLSRGCEIGEAHGAESGKRRQPGIRRGGDNGSQNTLRDTSAVLLPEIVRRCTGGPSPGALDGEIPVLSGNIDKDRCDATKLHLLRMQDGQRDGGRNPGINGISPRLQHICRYTSRNIMADGDSVAIVSGGGLRPALTCHSDQLAAIASASPVLKQDYATNAVKFLFNPAKFCDGYDQ